MLNHFPYRKFVSLGNGKRIMFRLVNAHDGEAFGRLFQDASREDLMFLKEDFQDSKALTTWLEQLQNHRVIPLVAVDLEAHRFIGSANLYLGKHSARHIGEVRIFVAPPYRSRGLGSCMLQELVALAMKEKLQWLKAEVPTGYKAVMRIIPGISTPEPITFAPGKVSPIEVSPNFRDFLRPYLNREI